MAAKEKVDKKLAKKIAEKKTPAGKLRDLSVAVVVQLLGFTVGI